jgi:hypothetical protein
LRNWLVVGLQWIILQSALALHARKIDKAFFCVDADEFDSEVIANVKSTGTFDQLSLYGRLEQSYPGSLLGCPGH